MCIPKHGVYMQSMQIIHTMEGLWTNKQNYNHMQSSSVNLVCVCVGGQSELVSLKTI